MIKAKIVMMFGGHKQFDLKLREALNAAVAGYTSHVELDAACRALGAGRVAASPNNRDTRMALVRALGRAGKRLVPTDPIDLKCSHLDLSGMGLTPEHGNVLAQLLRNDVSGSLTELNLDGFALPIKQLKGTDPVKSLDFSKKGLGSASASLIASSPSPKRGSASLDISEKGLAVASASVIARSPSPKRGLASLDISEKGLAVASASVIARSPSPKRGSASPDFSKKGLAVTSASVLARSPSPKRGWASLDISKKRLSVASASVIASCIKDNGVLKELKCVPLSRP